MTKRAPRRKAAAGDLEILHPERELDIAGVKLTMREYGFVEGLRLAAQMAPVVQALATLAVAEDGGAGLSGYAGIEAVFAAHSDAVTAMAAQACDQPVEWVRKLAPADGEALLFAWWAVNAPFFVRRVSRELQMRLMSQALAAPAGAMSTPPSAATTPAASPRSGAAPAVN